MSGPPALRPVVDARLGPDPIRGWLAVRHRDVADARRGHPAHDLAGWAVERGLTPLGSHNPSGYFAALPCDPRQQFNVARGTHRGRDVVVWHWRYQAQAGADSSPVGFATSVASDVRSSMPWYSWIPFLGGSGPAAYVGVPTTGGAALVGEAATLPDFQVSRPETWGPDRYRAPLGHGLCVRSRHGLETVLETLDRARKLGLERVLSAGGEQRSFRLRYRHGTLVLRCDGYADESGLDEVLDLTSLAATALAAACAPLHRPAAFAEPLPAPHAPWRLPTRLREAVDAHARAWNLTPEDPDAWHLAFPRSPVPGRALAVLRGRVADHHSARIVLCAEADPFVVNSGRTALITPAAGRPDTSSAGTVVEDPGCPDARLRWAVRDGLLTSWVLRWRAGELGDIALLARVAAEVSQRHGP